MGATERKERERQGRRLEIIRAAERVFVRLGLEAATMEDVAREAEFTKRTVYSYFPSKADLQSAVALRHMATLAAWFGEAARSDGTGLERVGRVGDAWVRFSREEPDAFQLMATYQFQPENPPESPNRGEIMRLNQEIFGLIAGAFAQGQADGSVRLGVDPAAAALFVISSSSGVLAAAAANRRSFGGGLSFGFEEFIALSMNLIRDAFRP
jgi:AcrR family transcriptional regulator